MPHCVETRKLFLCGVGNQNWILTRLLTLPPQQQSDWFDCRLPTTFSIAFNPACMGSIPDNIPDSKVHGANMGPIWGREDPGGPHVGPMNFAISDPFKRQSHKYHGARPSVDTWLTTKSRIFFKSFLDIIFKCIFVNEKFWISSKITIKFVPKGPINHTSALV